MPNIAHEERYATISRWYFKEGEYVRNGDALVEVMIEANTYKIIAEASGRLNDVRFNEGDVVSLSDIIANISNEA